MKNEVTSLREKAQRSLAAARKLHENGDYDFSVSRSYYSLFYIIEALLLIKNKTFSKHSSVISGFYHEYVENGPMELKYHAMIQRAFDLRNKGDYWSTKSVSPVVSEELLDDCQKFFERTKPFFKE